MWEEVDRILRQATSQIADQLANFLPGVMVSLLLLLTALVVAVVVRVRHDVVVADLVPRVGAAVELCLLRLRGGVLVDVIAVRGQPEAVDDPAPERAASVGGRDVRTAVIAGEARWRGRGGHGSREDDRQAQERATATSHGRA